MYNLIADDVCLGKDVVIHNFVNLYGCTIGDYTRIGAFVEIQKNVWIGSKVKVQSHTFICEGVTIEDEVFIGHGVTFSNVKYPRATMPNGELEVEGDWTCIPTLVKRGAVIGNNVAVLCGVTIGEDSMIGVGSVVTKDVPCNTIVAGNPARVLRPFIKEGCL